MVDHPEVDAGCGRYTASWSINRVRRHYKLPPWTGIPVLTHDFPDGLIGLFWRGESATPDDRLGGLRPKAYNRMNRVAAVLRAVATAFRRDQKSLWSLIGNNFILVCALVMQDGGLFIYLIVFVVMFLPMTTDPLRKVPRSRLGLLPLSTRELWLLRCIGPWVNPVTWAMAGLGIWAIRGKITPGLFAFCAGSVVFGFLMSSADVKIYRLWRAIPNFSGPLNQLIRKNLRDLLSTLDLYCAALVSVSGLAFRLAIPRLASEAIMIMTVLVVLALSSYAGALFGLDGKSGRSRYHLLPIPGWQLLAAKDAAFLIVTVPLVLPLAPLTGVGCALVALAAGRQKSIMHFREQARWRFSNGGTRVADIAQGIGQSVLISIAGAAIYFSSASYFLGCVTAWIASLWLYDKAVERAFRVAVEPAGHTAVGPVAATSP